MKVIDLFCGAGGFSEGFKQAGHEIIFGIDNNKDAYTSFASNFEEADVICRDILKFNSFPVADIVIGSPPCQEWSDGKQGKQTYDLTYINRFKEIVQDVNPAYWIWECAPKTSRLDNCKILDTINFGVPQKRKRAFHTNITLPEGGGKEMSVNEALGWKETKVLFNHRSLNIEAYSPVYLSNRPARTIVTWPPTIYKERKMTIDEVKIIMGFPKDYKLCGSKSSQYKQLGNAVCPPVAKEIAKRLK